MKLLCTKLPSGGVGCTVETINVNPLTYLELSKYCQQKPSNELDDFIWDFENLIMTIPNWERLSSFDVPAIMSYRKMFSVNLKGSYKIGDVEFSLSDVDFTDLSRVALSVKSVNLAGVEYYPSIKSAESFYKTLKIFEDKTDQLKFPVVASYLGIDSPDVIFKFTTEDVAVCERLYLYLLSQPILKKDGAEAILFGKASELFQNIIVLYEVTEDKIRFSENVQL